MTEERIKTLVEFLKADVDRARRITAMSAEEATAEINAAGYDFTIEEIKEFSEKVREVVSIQNMGELDEQALDQVAGGSWGTFVLGVLIGLGIASGCW